MSTFLVAFLVMRTLATKPYERARASENNPDDLIFDLEDDDNVFLDGQRKLNGQLEKTAILPLFPVGYSE